MNYTQSISVSFLVLSFFCNAAELPNNHRSIPFNRDIVGKPHFIRYNTDKDFTIGGDTGLEIQPFSQKDLSIITYNHKLLGFAKDPKAVVAFTQKDILCVPFHNAPYNIVSMNSHQLIKCVAIDSDKNSMFTACYDYSNKTHSIAEHNNCLNPYMEQSSKHFDIIDSPICSMALSSHKDVLCLLDHNSISLRKTNDLESVFKKCDVPTGKTSSIQVFGNMLIAYGSKIICIIDSIDKNDSPLSLRILKQYSPVADNYKKIRAIDFHPSGLIAALVSNYLKDKGAIHYWDIATGDKVDKTVINNTACDFCFNSDGCKVAIAFDKDCIEQPVSFKVVKQYILPPLWLKLKSIQKQCNLPQDIMVQCMNAFTRYFN